MGFVRIAAALMLIHWALVLSSTDRAQAAPLLKGIALVIGQSDYENLARLPNPSRDARQIEELLNQLGLETDMVENRDTRRLRRDFDAFLEDAEGADVALVYFAGHGIEANGENFLLPVDADLDHVRNAGESFVSLEEILGELRRKARITIVLLDACRTNPFPADTLLSRAQDGVPAVISASGLGIPRSAVSLTGSRSGTSVDRSESLGIVIGYAAAPGEVALDGPEGGTSPYAAALLKHLGASDFDFADVMTMVSEEVYLSTRNRQQPWTNTSLRRLLYFGNVVEPDQGEEAQIRGARRDLLLTIATSPRETRSLVEALSQNDAVPLDALYGILKDLDVDTSTGPDSLAKQLKAGAENLRRFMEQRIDTAARHDPELIHYAALADRAQAEGAIALSRQFRERASARADHLRSELDRRQEELKSDRLEIAATYAEEARSALLAFDNLRAAARYGDAYEQVRRWDDKLAWRYKSDEGFALADYGDRVGDRASIQRGLEAHSTALQLVSRQDDPEAWATNKHGTGVALAYLARGGMGTQQLEDAMAAFDEALQVRTRETYPLAWATTQLSIGNVAMTYGHSQGDAAWFKRSADAYRDAAGELRNRDYDWTVTQRNLGLALSMQGFYANDAQVLRDAVKAFERALETMPREDMPQEWARTEGNRAEALLALATLEPGSDYLDRGVSAIREATSLLERDRSPMDWALAQHYLGDAELKVADRSQSPDDFRAAIAAFERALDVWTRDSSPIDWATASTRMSEGLERLGVLTNDRAMVMRARTLTAEAGALATDAGYEHYASYYAGRLAAIDAALESMK